MLNFAAFLIYVAVTSFTPGPNNIMSMSNAARAGYRNTLKFLFGIAVGFMLVMLICGFLNVILVSLLPKMKFWLNLLGAVYMIYLALHIFLSKPSTEEDKDGLNTFWAGFTMQFMNVKVILYGITVYSMFIVPAFQNPLTISLFAPLLAVIGFISISLWAVGGNLFRSLLNRHWRLFNVSMSLLLLYTAVSSLVHKV
jgi:cysteine/O-acetylserine efflux protein